jgi:hypothetical protein
MKHVGPKPRDWRDRFWEKVDKRDAESCWNWIAGTDLDGYGLLKMGSRKTKRYSGKASRLSYALAYGPIPDGKNVCHRCDNPKCVNPAHLFLGSTLDNIRDMDAKGRRRPVKGEAHGRHKLSDAQVQEIRTALANGVTGYRLAPMYGVSHQHISKIKHGLKR